MRVTAPVNAPRSCPNSSLSVSSRESPAQLRSTNGFGRARRAVVDVAREHALAGAGVAEQEHRRRVRRDRVGELLHLAHRGRVEGRLVPGRARREPPEARVRPAERRRLEPLGDQRQEARRVDRLGHEVVGAALHRLDGDVDRRDRGHDDHRQIGVHGAQQRHHVEPRLRSRGAGRRAPRRAHGPLPRRAPRRRSLRCGPGSRRARRGRSAPDGYRLRRRR